MKFTIDWCVFAYPENANPPPAQAACSEVCAGPNNRIKTSLTDRLLEANSTLQYLYCNGPNILDVFDDCATCLNNVPDAQILGQCKFRTCSNELHRSSNHVESRCQSIKGGVCAKARCWSNGQA